MSSSSIYCIIGRAGDSSSTSTWDLRYMLTVHMGMYHVDPVCVSIRPSFLFIDVSVIGLSETRYHTIVKIGIKICRQSGGRIHRSGFLA